ncbi:hypothetical protein FH972_024559 [Carpinus fangiana]|uniref:Uncharacterized protein n=1 Tax=Carpinus fangiana TaxID=176857 RepID=A0A5N6KYC3_9ROSI|nr:hypothetical protein FH972_024559 [Carpinus fangiana]
MEEAGSLNSKFGLAPRRRSLARLPYVASKPPPAFILSTTHSTLAPSVWELWRLGRNVQRPDASPKHFWLLHDSRFLRCRPHCHHLPPHTANRQPPLILYPGAAQRSGDQRTSLLWPQQSQRICTHQVRPRHRPERAVHVEHQAGLPLRDGHIPGQRHHRERSRQPRRPTEQSHHLGRGPPPPARARTPQPVHLPQPEERQQGQGQEEEAGQRRKVKEGGCRRRGCKEEPSPRPLQAGQPAAKVPDHRPDWPPC